MKYYVYISENKLDMLYPQVPHEPIRKSSSEFKVDLKLISATRKTEGDSEENRITRLEAVCAFIRRRSVVGTVDVPGEYVEDTASMRWGPFVQIRERITYDGNESPDDLRLATDLVYFGGSVGNTVVALHGSMQHVLGSGGKSEATEGVSSGLPTLYNALEALARGSTLEDFHQADEDGLNGTDVLRWVAGANDSMKGPRQKLTFLAKRLGFGRIPDGRSVFIGTPIYVALFD